MMFYTYSYRRLLYVGYLTNFFDEFEAVIAYFLGIVKEFEEEQRENTGRL